MYAYSEKSDLSHAFYTSSSPKEYMGGTELPSGFVNNTKMIKVYGLQDRQLSDLQYSKFIDDWILRQSICLNVRTISWD